MMNQTHTKPEAQHTPAESLADKLSRLKQRYYDNQMMDSGWSEREANSIDLAARVLLFNNPTINAASELLELLQRSLPMWEHYVRETGDNDVDLLDYLDEVRSAIAKAQG